MDNAAYHKKLPSHAPRKNQRKAQLQEACEHHGIAYEAKETRDMLWEKLHPGVTATYLPVVVQMAKDAGHEVLFTPPHHSDLQPIEMVWAKVKGDVGCQYTTDTTMKDVLRRLKKAFSDLQSVMVQKCIDKTNRELDDYHKESTLIDEIDSSDSDDSDNDSINNEYNEESDGD